MTWIDTEIVWGQTSKHWGCVCRRVSTSSMHLFNIFQSPGILALADVFVMTGTTTFITFSKQDHLILIVKLFFFFSWVIAPWATGSGKSAYSLQTKTSVEFPGRSRRVQGRHIKDIGWLIQFLVLSWCFVSIAKTSETWDAKQGPTWISTPDAAKGEVKPLTT